VTIAVTATSTSITSNTNSATQTLTVGGVANHPPDCGTSHTSNINLWPPNHKMVSIDILSVTGITDPDGDPVTVTITPLRRTSLYRVPATAPAWAPESLLFGPNATAMAMAESTE
jgi:hypothetical protein